MSSEEETKDEKKDRIDEILDYLSTNDDSSSLLPDSLKTFKYADGWNPDKLDEELQSHPFFMTKFPEPNEPLPPLLEAFQQLKYSEDDNTPHELALNHKEDGLFHFKIKKYRIAATCFTTGLSQELKSKSPDNKTLSVLYNNRAACSFYVQNYRSCIRDCENAIKYDNCYVKAIKRGIAASEILKDWDSFDKFVKVGDPVAAGDELFKRYIVDKRRVGRAGKTKNAVLLRKHEVVSQNLEEAKDQLMKIVISRGIQVKNLDFLNSDAAKDGKVVKATASSDNRSTLLCWPVLFMYPQFSQSDFVEMFPEHCTFSDQLAEILENEAPPWDKNAEYKLDNIEVFYINQGFIQVDINASLLDVMTTPTYSLPSNGVPGFFVLAKGNEFCQVFKDRVEMEGN